jgi:hypothetical protein
MISAAKKRSLASKSFDEAVGFATGGMRKNLRNSTHRTACGSQRMLSSMGGVATSLMLI